MSGFHPAPEVSSFLGGPIPESQHFFVPPPDCIGEIISAQSELLRTESPLGWGGVGRGLLVGTFSGALAGSVVVGFGGVDVRLVLITIVWGLFLAAWRHPGPTRYRLAYIGEGGVARATLVGALSAPPSWDVLRFPDAALVLTQVISAVLPPGVTRYHHMWVSEGGQILLELEGRFEGKGAQEGFDILFAGLAEGAWTRWLGGRGQSRLDAGESVAFPVLDFPDVGVRDGSMKPPGALERDGRGLDLALPRSGDVVRVSTTWIERETEAGVRRLAVDEVRGIRLTDNDIVLTPGVNLDPLEIPYRDRANANYLVSLIKGFPVQEFTDDTICCHQHASAFVGGGAREGLHERPGSRAVGESSKTS